MLNLLFVCFDLLANFGGILAKLSNLLANSVHLLAKPLFISVQRNDLGPTRCRSHIRCRTDAAILGYVPLRLG